MPALRASYNVLNVLQIACSYYVILSSLCVCACVVTSSRPADDTDYDEHLTDDAGNDVINDVSAGRLMTCIGLNEMPHTVPPGERAR